MRKKFLFVSNDGLIGDIAWQISQEGHEVRYYIQNPESADIADGFVPKTVDWRRVTDWADTIIFDDVLGHGTLAKELRDGGKFVVGGTPYTDMLEDDRSFGQQELKNFGIPIIPFQNFSGFDEAISFLSEKPGRYVVKPSGIAQNLKRLLFVGEEEDGKDVVQVLEAYKRTTGNHIKEFQLQKRVTGVEVAVGAFFNGNAFVLPININFEHKKLFPGNLGPSTGEMGTTMFWSEPNKLFNATLKKMEEKLKSEKFIGYIDLNCIVNSNGIYPLEFTCRFGYPTIFIQQDSMQTPIGDFFHALARGEIERFKTKNGFHIGVRICVPPYPYDDPECYATHSKESVILFKTPNLNGIHIEDVKQVNHEWLVAGNTGVVLVVCGSGTSMKQAQAQAYNRIKNIMIPNMFYRKDIGDRWFEEDGDKLHNWGYLREV